MVRRRQGTAKDPDELHETQEEFKAAVKSSVGALWSAVGAEVGTTLSPPAAYRKTTRPALPDSRPRLAAFVKLDKAVMEREVVVEVGESDEDAERALLKVLLEDVRSRLLQDHRLASRLRQRELEAHRAALRHAWRTGDVAAAADLLREDPAWLGLLRPSTAKALVASFARVAKRLALSLGVDKAGEQKEALDKLRAKLDDLSRKAKDALKEHKASPPGFGPADGLVVSEVTNVLLLAAEVAGELAKHAQTPAEETEELGGELRSLLGKAFEAEEPTAISPPGSPLPAASTASLHPDGPDDASSPKRSRPTPLASLNLKITEAPADGAELLWEVCVEPTVEEPVLVCLAGAYGQCGGQQSKGVVLEALHGDPPVVAAQLPEPTHQHGILSRTSDGYSAVRFPFVGPKAEEAVAVTVAFAAIRLANLPADQAKKTPEAQAEWLQEAALKVDAKEVGVEILSTTTPSADSYKGASGRDHKTGDTTEGGLADHDDEDTTVNVIEVNIATPSTSNGTINLGE